MMQRSEEGKRDLRERDLLKQGKARENKTNKNKKPCSESTVSQSSSSSSSSFFLFQVSLLLLLSSSFFYQVHKREQNKLQFFCFFTSQDHKGYGPPNSLSTLSGEEKVCLH
jgi:hypothetical protein